MSSSVLRGSFFQGKGAAERFCAPGLRGVPILTLVIFLTPVGVGFLGTLLPSFGYFPALGGQGIHFDVWGRLWAQPGLAGAVRLSLVTGVGATVVSFALACGFLAAFHQRAWFARLQVFLTPLLAIPHVAVSVGLLFILAPSGWIVRFFSPWATGWQTPPDLVTVQDPWGLSLVLALVLKETPYLILTGCALLPQLRPSVRMRVAASLGYRPCAGWVKVVFPDFYRLMRLPLVAVLVFSLSVVDMALIIGPGTPPPLSVLVLRWYLEPDLSFRFLAAAGGVLQLGLVLAVLSGWCLVVRLCRWAVCLTGGRRRVMERACPLWSAAVSGLLGGLAVLSFAGLVVWSLAWRWSYPHIVPDRFTLQTWVNHGGHLLEAGMTTVVIAGATGGLALVLSLGCLELEKQRHHGRTGHGRTGRSLLLLYLPLLVPQVTFLFGAQVFLMTVGLGGTWPGVIWLHLVFVLPYVFLSLAESYRQQDHRYGQIALSLGRSRWATFVRVRVPLLLRPICFALALGFAVSVAQYLPTLLAGAGRLTTLATETVALASGGNRRVVAVVTLFYAMLPLLVFGLALVIPTLCSRHRRGGRCS